MTVEEAKDYFGENFIEPTLGWFNKRYDGPDKISKAKKGRKYWFHYTMYDKEFVEQFGKRSGWVLGTCVFRRHGISFFKFDGSKDKDFEYEFYDGSSSDVLVPETISLKEFKINPDLMFAFKDMEGRVKYID